MLLKVSDRLELAVIMQDEILFDQVGDRVSFFIRDEDLHQFHDDCHFVLKRFLLFLFLEA